MNRYSHKNCRRYGVKLCQSLKCPVLTRKYPPGMHGPRQRIRLTEYGTQLAEKQKAKISYGLNERQFRRYYQEATRQKGDTSVFLPQILERRLDNIVYRLGFAKTRAQARQLVNHGFFLVNSKLVSIPSYQVDIKDEISIKPNKAKAKTFEDLSKRLEKHQTPQWIHVDSQLLVGKVISLPKPQDAEQTFNSKLIIEFYSK